MLNQYKEDILCYSVRGGAPPLKALLAQLVRALVLCSSINELAKGHEFEPHIVQISLFSNSK